MKDKSLIIMRPIKKGLLMYLNEVKSFILLAILNNT